MCRRTRHGSARSSSSCAPFRGNLEKKDLGMKTKERMRPHSLISACILNAYATCLQASQGYPSAVSTSFLLLGATSVIHHCRLDTWWKRDIWRVLDYASILLFAISGCVAFWDRLIWWFSCLAILTITALIWTDAVSEATVPSLHALTHIIICVAISILLGA